MLTVCTWLWGSKYSVDDVAKVVAGFRRHLAEPHRFVIFTEDFYRKGLDDIDGVEVWPIIRDRHLIDIKGCFVRLRLFDPEWQAMCKFSAGDRIVNVDLDVVVTGPLSPLFNRAENFVILHGANASNPCKFNGSLFMLRAGAHPEVWADFSMDAAAKVPFHEFPDDQGWLWQKLPTAAGWNCGPQSGVYAFQKTTWPKGDDLPADARMVVFPGWRSPEKFKHLPWVREHWVA